MKKKSTYINDDETINNKHRDILEVNEISPNLFNQFLISSIARKIPSLIDGIIPVQRRAIVSLDHMWIYGQKKTKVQTVVGDVIGQYHPNGDTSVSSAIVRLWQSHELRYPLIDNKGTNFWSLWVWSSAPRYLECGLSEFSKEVLLSDYSDNTCMMVDTYNGKRKEPVTFKPSIPVFLLMSSWSDIATGIKWQRVPHNIIDVCNSYLEYLNNQNVKVKTLVKKLQWPDFPSGWLVINTEEELIDMYNEGRGTFIVRGTYELRQEKWENAEIHITSLPFGIIPEDFINRVIKVKSESKSKFKDVIEIFDQSSGEDENWNLKIDICIVLKNKNAEEEVIKELIAYNTGFQSKDSRILHWWLDAKMKPVLVGLKEMYEIFFEDRLEVLTKKFTAQLEDLEHKLHIQEGLEIVSKDIDTVISIIRKSEWKEEAKQNLMKKLKISEIQANAIGWRTLFTLTKIDSLEITNKIKELTKQIKETQKILKWGRDSLIEVMIEEVENIKEKFKNSKRLTQIDTSISTEDREVKIEEKLDIQDRKIYIAASDTMIASIDSTNIDESKDVLEQLNNLISFKDKSEVKYFVKTSNLTDTNIYSNYGCVYWTIWYNLTTNRSWVIIHSIFKKFDKDEKIIALTAYNKDFEKNKDYHVIVGDNGKGYVSESLSNFYAWMKERSQYVYFKADETLLNEMLDYSDKKNQPLGVMITTDEQKLHFLDIEQFVVREWNGWVGAYVIRLKWEEKINCVKVIYQNTPKIQFGKEIVDFKEEEFSSIGWRGRRIYMKDDWNWEITYVTDEE